MKKEGGKLYSSSVRKLLFLFLLCAVSISVGQGLYFLKQGFSLRRIHSLAGKVSDNWNSEVMQALSQPYFYIGRGRQCFAFASADEKYVLKLLRTDIYKLPLWARVLPVTSKRTHMLCDRREREQFILSSMHIAFEELQLQTGLLALHLGESPASGKKLALIDATGYRHYLPLGKTPFVLQKKLPILMEVFQKALQNGNRGQAEKILDALLAIVIERGEKGILNRDRSFLRNYGFDGQQAFQIDVGSFFRIEKMENTAAFHKSVNDSMDAVKEWLANIDPAMLQYLNHKLAASMASREMR